MNLSDNEKEQVIEIIKAGGKLPKEMIYKMYEAEEDVFLFWNGRKEEVTNVSLPFHTIEHIDEPRKEKSAEGDSAGALFDTRGRV